MAKLGDIALKLFLDGSRARTELTNLQGQVDRLNGSGSAASKNLSVGFSGMAAAVTGAAAVVSGVVAGLTAAVNVASRFQEANSKFNVVFAGMEDNARAMRKTLVDSYAMSTTEATKYLSSVQDLLVPMGMARNSAATMSGEIVKLAADLGSFNNLETDQVMTDIQAALTGSGETMKKYGVIINETSIKQKAYESKLWDGKSTLDAATKAQAAYQIMIDSSGAAIGDMSRTMDSYANTKKRISAATEDLSLQLGAVFLPIWNKVLQAILKFIDAIGPETIGGVIFATWEIISEFASRVYRAFSGIGKAIVAVVTGEWSNIGPALEQTWNAVAGGWGDTIQRVKEQYAEGGRAFNEFVAGEKQTFSEAQTGMTETANLEQDKRDQKAAENHQKFIARINDRIAKSREVNVQEGESWQALADYMYESGRMSLDDYKYLLDERILTAQMLYGEESLEYMKLVDQKAKLDKDYSDKKKKSDQQEIQTQRQKTGEFVNAMSQAKTTNKAFWVAWKASAISQAIIDTYAGANKALATYLPPFGFVAAGAIIAAGMANVANITAQKFATGGLVSGPTFGLLGEAGPELVAPKKDFITVVNEMKQSGEIGQSTQSNILTTAIGDLKRVIASQRLVTRITGDELAVVLENGQATLSKLEF